jgi:hypothetical protein
MRLAKAAVVLALAVTASAQDKKEADRIGKDKAPTVLKKALNEVQKKKSAALEEVAELSAGLQKLPPAKFEGILRKDFAAAKGSAEIYARGANTLVNVGARFDPPEELQGPEGLSAQSFRNPSLLLDELGKISSAPQFGPDETVESKECKVVDVAADPALLRQQLKEFADRLNKSMRQQLGFAGAQIFDMKNAMDEKNSAATYHVCIGKDDLLIYRIDYVLRPKIKNGALPPQLRIPPEMDQKIDVHLSKWDEDVAFDIPAVVKAKLGVK